MNQSRKTIYRTCPGPTPPRLLVAGREMTTLSLPSHRFEALELTWATDRVARAVVARQILES